MIYLTFFSKKIFSTFHTLVSNSNIILREGIKVRRQLSYYLTVAAILVATVFVGSGLVWSQVQAQNLPANETQLATSYFNLDTTASTAGLKTSESLGTRIGKMVNLVLRFLGIIFVLLMIAGGMMWMTAGGNEEKIGKAKKLIIAGAIGFLITFISFILVTIAESFTFSVL